MNQRSLATVLLRVAGVYMLYQLVAAVALGGIWHQATAMDDDGGLLRALLSLSLAAHLFFSLAFIFFAGSFARRLFPADETVIAEGRIDSAALLPVGLCLLGIFVFVRHFPALAEIGLEMEGVFCQLG